MRSTTFSRSIADPDLPRPGRILPWAGALAGCLFACVVPGWSAESIEERLSPEEFRRAGLHKLTPEELRFLNQHVFPATTAAAADARPDDGEPPPKAVDETAPKSSATSEPAPLLRGESAFGMEQKIASGLQKQRSIPVKITSRIDGAFKGWSGRTEFRLENGQVWRQAERSQFVASALNPLVTIEKGSLGAYYLRIEGHRSRVKVERIR